MPMRQLPFKTVLGVASSLVVTLFFSVVVGVIAALTNVQTLHDHVPFMRDFLENSKLAQELLPYLPAFLLVLVDSTIPPILSVLARVVFREVRVGIFGLLAFGRVGLECYTKDGWMGSGAFVLFCACCCCCSSPTHLCMHIHTPTQVRTVSEAHVTVFRRLYFFLLWNNFLSTCWVVFCSRSASRKTRWDPYLTISPPTSPPPSPLPLELPQHVLRHPGGPQAHLGGARQLPPQHLLVLHCLRDDQGPYLCMRVYVWMKHTQDEPVARTHHTNIPLTTPHPKQTGVGLPRHGALPHVLLLRRRLPLAPHGRPHRGPARATRARVQPPRATGGTCVNRYIVCVVIGGSFVVS